MNISINRFRNNAKSIQINEFFIQTVEDKYKDKNGINLKPGSVTLRVMVAQLRIAEKFK